MANNKRAAFQPPFLFAYPVEPTDETAARPRDLVDFTRQIN